MLENQQRAWIIGASSGIGRSLALCLAKQGWNVAVSARNLEALQSMVSEHPESISAHAVDITNRDQINQVVDEVTQANELGAVFINAGAYQPMSAKEFSYDTFERINRVNYLGVVAVMDAVLPILRQQGGGQIYITASVSGYCGLPYAAPYSATKAALINMAESLMPELEQENIQLRIINPGFVRSPLTDKNDFSMPFLMEPDEAAEAIMKHMQGDAFEIAFPRRMKWLMSAFRFLPYRIYFSLTRKMLK